MFQTKRREDWHFFNAVGRFAVPNGTWLEGLMGTSPLKLILTTYEDRVPKPTKPQRFQPGLGY